MSTPQYPLLYLPKMVQNQTVYSFIELVGKPRREVVPIPPL